MQKKWFYRNKSVDYTTAKDLGVHPSILKILADRGVEGTDAVKKFINPDMGQVSSGEELTDMAKGVDIMYRVICAKKKIRVMADYDVDGTTSGYILWKGIRSLGGNCDIYIPHRVKDGYGLHEDAIRDAAADKVQVIITCDNGIAAASEVRLAKELGMTVVVTDHHEVPYTEENGTKHYILPEADAVIDPKRAEDHVFKEICGAVVAWKFVGLLYKRFGREENFKNSDFLEMASLGTVCDVMELQNENRALVKEGLKRMQHTSNIGMQALLKTLDISGKELGTYDYGFLIGPCINAEGRLDTAMNAFSLFAETDPEKAAQKAEAMKELNAERQELTKAGMEEAFKIVDSSMTGDKVLVVYLPGCHESIAGIIAGKVRERYNKPSFVLTDSNGILKGSGRSIEKYPMYDGLVKCKDLLLGFGGHPMAAGLSLNKENLEAFRTRLNETCDLTEDDFIPKIMIDVILPVEFLTEEFIKQLSLLEPFGKGNEKPVFAQKHVRATRAEIIGKNKNVLRLTLANKACKTAVAFHDADELKGRVDGKIHDFAMIYYPDINEWQGRKSLQAAITDVC